MKHRQRSAKTTKDKEKLFKLVSLGESPPYLLHLDWRKHDRNRHQEKSRLFSQSFPEALYYTRKQYLTPRITNYATLSDIVRPHLHVLFWWKLHNLLRSLRSLRTDIDDTHTEPNMDIIYKAEYYDKEMGIPPATCRCSNVCNQHF